MIAFGLPDLGNARAAGSETFAPLLGEPSRYAHLPSGLVVPALEDVPACPDIRLELVRGRDPGRPPEPHGLLDLRLRIRPPAPAALDQLAEVDPRAAVSPAALVGGYLRIELLAGAAVDADAAAAVAEPVALVANGLDAARVVRYLSAPAATFLSGAFAEKAVAIGAQAELVIAAVARRLPITVSFAAASLSAALTELGGADGLVTRSGVADLWTSGRVPATGIATADLAEAAEVLADWTLALTASPAASRTTPVQPTYLLGPGSLSGQVTWNLSELRSISHIAVAELDLADAVRRAVDAGATSIFRQEVVADPLDTGMVEIAIDANMPRRLEGIASVGVRLTTPPAPPWRPDRLADSRLLTSDRPAPVRWQLSPTETLAYDVNAFVLISEPQPARADGPARHSTDRRVAVGVADLPVDLVTVGASEELLGEAVVHIGLEDLRFDLSLDSPQAAAPVTDGQSLTVTATAIATGAAASAGTIPAHSTVITPSDFPAYGTHEVQVTVEFDTQAQLVVVELRADADDDAVAVLPFTPQTGTRAWRYHNASVFGGGYRYRVTVGTGAPSAFSVPLDDAALHIKASGVPGASPPEKPPADPPPGPFEAEGFTCVPGPDADTWRVWPHSPGVAHGPDGQPLVGVFATGDSGFLQLEARLFADDAAFERLRGALGGHLGVNPLQLRLQPGVTPQQVRQAALLIAAGSGTRELATNPTSGMPPYAAVFDVPLDAQTLPHAQAAAAGQAGHVFVRYDVSAEPQFMSSFQPVTDVGNAGVLSDQEKS
jgi:hypothetical protein